MQANLLLRRIRQTCEPVKAAIAGSVTWHKQSGNPVQQYDTLATIQADSDTIAITSPHKGTLRTLMIPEGELAEKGAILCYVEPDESLHPTSQEPSAKMPHKGTNKPINGHNGSSQGETPLPQNGTPKALSGSPNGHAVSPANGPVSPINGPAGAANGDIVIPDAKAASPLPANLVELAPPTQSISDGNGAITGTANSPARTANGDIGSPAVQANGKAQSKKGKEEVGNTSSGKKNRPKTRHRSYHVTDQQEEAIRELSLQMKLDRSAPNVNESELVRCAIEMLLELPQPALLAMIEKNREKEKAQRYGTGWPRPGRK